MEKKKKLKIRFMNRNAWFKYNGDFKLIRMEYQQWYDGWQMFFALFGFELTVTNRRYD